MTFDPGHVPEVSCRKVRLERGHPPHIYSAQLEDNSAILGMARCWGYPRYREEDSFDGKPRNLKEAVQQLRDSK